MLGGWRDWGLLPPALWQWLTLMVIQSLLAPPEVGQSRSDCVFGDGTIWDQVLKCIDCHQRSSQNSLLYNTMANRNRFP